MLSNSALTVVAALLGITAALKMDNLDAARCMYP